MVDPSEWLTAEALDPDIQWDASGTWNWRDYIGEHTKAVWGTFTDEQKIALAMDAEAECSRAWAEMPS